MIRPKRNNVQKQKLTVLLRSIISEYPAGGGVLRELCQNADDAGATELLFVLDEKTYPTDPLLVEGLDQYQGPSLLAYNNSIFTEQDFESLSNIGDSRKIQDLSSTGKFGRGFNSVYNWTDCPSILSGDSLVLLDPHESWSASTEAPGGPTYDFVASGDIPAMKNQLAAFGSIETDFGQPFDGTLIRLPLRTNEQATRSQICKKPTSVGDIKKVFQKFTDEMVETLLFLKNVRKITLRIGDTIFAAAEAKNYLLSKSGARTRTNRPGDLQKPYMSVLIEKKTERWDASFVTEIELQQGTSKSVSRFAITHHMRADVGDHELSQWARNVKLFPWVAIAAPLDKSDRKTGRLFTSLPLPVNTRHPVHIHAMFSITPDRANIHNGDDTAASDTSDAALGARWNKWVFDNVVTEAWLHNLHLLETLTAQKAICFAGWNYWPAGKQGPGHEIEHGTEVLRRLIKRIIQDDEPLLPTVLGSVYKPADCLYEKSISPELHKACVAAKIPVVVPPADSYEFKTGDLCNGLTDWSSKGLRAFMNSHTSNFDGLELRELQTLTEVALGDGDFEDLGRCAARLLPLTDGTYASFSRQEKKKYKLAFDAQEQKLFEGCLDSTVDRLKLSEFSYDSLCGAGEEAVLQHTSITRWNAQSAALYCRSSICKSTQTSTEDILEISEEKDRKWIIRLWEWIVGLGYPEAVIPTFSELHLVPLGGNLHRKVGRQPWYTLDVSDNQALRSVFGSVNRSAADDCSYFPVFLGDLPAGITDLFRVCGLLTNGDDIDSLLQWLVQAREKGLFQRLGEGEHLQLVDEIAAKVKKALPREKIYEGHPIVAACRKLPLFHRVNDRRPGEKRASWSKYMGNRIGVSSKERTTWSDISTPRSYYGIDTHDIGAIQLRIGSKIFLDTSNRAEAQILRRIIPVLQTSELLAKHIMPFILKSSEPNQDLCWFAVRNMDILGQEDSCALSKVAFVPTLTSVQSPCQLVHPDQPAAKLLFEEELSERCPQKDILRSYAYQLEKLGMVTKINYAYILDRIHTYGTRKETYDSLFDKVKHLFTDQPPAGSCLPDSYLSKKWIPARSPSGQKLLSSGVESRDSTYGKLLNYALDICHLPVSFAWCKFLRWDGIPSQELVRKQFLAVVEKQDRESLKRLLDSTLLTPLKASGELDRTAWVPGTSGLFFQPSAVFKQSGHFPPYMDNVHKDFRQLLFKSSLCSITLEPSFEKLQQTLELFNSRSTPLNTEELHTVTKLLGRVTSLYPSKDFSSFKAPDTDGYMRDIHQLTAEYSDDPDDKDIKFLHRDVTTGTSQVLKIPTSKDRLLQSIANSEDFAQEEDPIVMIKDSLQRYPIDATFDEYLANAEDSGSATEIAWLLDSGMYQNSKVLTPELADFQGPSLMSWNDGVFTEKDLKSLIRVGVGSKGKDASKLGRFGRGSLTMYHWTCVPMILSGDYLVIFDPQRQRLHHDVRHKGRCAGTRLRISDVRREYPDQLKPFEGKFGFDKQDHYKGTIFRFPLRADMLDPLSPTQPTQANARVHLDRYFQDANYSLLFLRRVGSIKALERVNAASESDNLLWRVSASSKGPVLPASSLNIVRVEYSECTMGSQETTGSAAWCVQRVVEGNHAIPGHLRNIRDTYRLQVRYGIALPVRPKFAPGRVFMDLPLRKVYTDLVPVSWTADMVLQSNRESLSLAPNEHGSDWNNWIIQEKIVPLYFSALEELYQAVANGGIKAVVSDYWPAFVPPDEHSKHDLTSLFSQYFWKEVSKSGCRLYPSLAEGRLLRRDEALFNFLDVPFPSDGPNSKGIQLCDLLVEIAYKNIVTLPGPLSESFKEAGLQQSPEFRTIDPAFMREFSKQRANITQLRQICKNRKNLPFTKVIQALLSIVLSDDPKPETLEGCFLIPIQLNKMPGTISTSPASEKYLLDPMDRILDSRLLALKPHLRVEAPAKALREQLLNFNVEHATCQHIPALLKGCPTEGETYAKVLSAVWCSIDRYIDKAKGRDGREECRKLLGDLLVLKAMKPNSSEFRFYSLEEFEKSKSPLVLQQELPAATRFVSCFPGLGCVDRVTYFKSESSAEDIRNPRGFSRLMISLFYLAQSIGAGTYLEKCIDEVYGDDRTEILQIFGTIDLESPEILDRSIARATFKSLRIWPIKLSNGATRNVAAKDLTLAPKEDYDCSKIAISGNFLNQSYQRQYRKLLEKLDVETTGVWEFLERHVTSAGRLPQEKLEEYIHFFKWFCTGRDVSWYNVAIDGDRRFQKPTNLYDYREAAFRGAFRQKEPSRFLHPRLRDSGHNIRGLISTPSLQNMRLCAAAIHERYQAAVDNGASTDAHLYEDAKAVFERLGLVVTEARKSSPGHDIRGLFEYKFVPVMSSFPISYRSPRMEQLVPHGSILLRRLAEVIQQEDMPVAWSESPVIAVSVPARVSEVLRSEDFLLPKVVQHLRYLASIYPTVSTEDIPEFCLDVQKTYQYLAEYPCVAARELQEEAVWLNIDSYTHLTKEQLAESWTTAANLVEGLEYDTGNLRQVGDFLRPYTVQNGLLVLCGMQKVKHAQALRRVTDNKERSHADDLCLRLNKFRESRKYTDFILRVNSSDIHVHRIVLAAKSEFFRKMLDNNMTEAVSGVMVCQDVGHETILDLMVKYMYCGELEAEEKEETRDMLDLYVEIMRIADMWMLDGLMEEVEVRLSASRFVRPETVREIQKVAETYGAVRLLEVCKEYVRDNKAIVDRAMENQRDVEGTLWTG